MRKIRKQPLERWRVVGESPRRGTWGADGAGSNQRCFAGASGLEVPDVYTYELSKSVLSHQICTKTYRKSEVPEDETLDPHQQRLLIKSFLTLFMSLWAKRGTTTFMS